MSGNHNVVRHALILGIWGRAGGNGIPGLIVELKSRLIQAGVLDDHLLAVSWHPNDNDNPFAQPDTAKHVDILAAREPSPSYVAIFGHSYGAWAACRLSRQLSVQPNFVGLIDPVFGPNGDDEQIVKPVGEIVHNWYQRNSVTEPTVIEDCSGNVVGCFEGLSCGRSIEGIHNHKVTWRRDWNGDQIMRNCGFGLKMPRHAFHLNIDSDRYVWRQIIEQIEADILAL